MTQPTTAEPISVRIARLKGCEPVSDGDGGWMCHCALNEHGDWCAECRDRHEDINGACPTPAASFVLLAEMVEGVLDSIPIRIERDFCYSPEQMKTYWLSFEGLPDVEEDAPTLAEAIALAWIAWKESRQ